jgi:hypothetical protein
MQLSNSPPCDHHPDVDAHSDADRSDGDVDTHSDTDRSNRDVDAYAGDRHAYGNRYGGNEHADGHRNSDADFYVYTDFHRHADRNSDHNADFDADGDSSGNRRLRRGCHNHPSSTVRAF